jgi:hypothetical protein
LICRIILNIPHIPLISIDFMTFLHPMTRISREIFSQAPGLGELSVGLQQAQEHPFHHPETVLQLHPAAQQWGKTVGL